MGRRHAQTSEGREKLTASPALNAGQRVRYLFGCGVYRRYGFTLLKPLGKSVFASASFTAGVMMQSSPSFQLAGVATLNFEVNWSESTTRNNSSKLRPHEAG